MRFTLNRSLPGLALAGLLFATTGCNSGFTMPGMSWLSWGGDPTPTQLSAAPQKPSTRNLPSPSATTNPATRAANASFATSPYGAPNKSPYYTGPYRTGQTAAQPAATQGGYPATTTPSGIAANPVGTRPAAGYQSPYQSPPQQSRTTGSNVAAGAYRTADARAGTYAPSGSVPLPGNTAQTTTAPWQQQSQVSSNTYNNPVAPTAYGEQSQTPSGSQSATNQFGVGTAGGTQAGLSQRQGPYRPGSTARDTGVLDASGRTSTSSTPSSIYGGTAPSVPSPTYSGYAYPTTGQ